MGHVGPSLVFATGATLGSAFRPPDRAGEYTARRRSCQRSGWLRRSSHSHSGGPASGGAGCKRSHKRCCKSRGTCSWVQGAHKAAPWGDSSSQCAPFQISVPHGVRSQNHAAIRLHSSHRPAPAPATTHVGCAPAPSSAQASKAAAPAKEHSANTAASQKLRPTG